MPRTTSIIILILVLISAAVGVFLGFELRDRASGPPAAESQSPAPSIGDQEDQDAEPAPELESKLCAYLLLHGRLLYPPYEVETTVQGMAINGVLIDRPRQAEARPVVEVPEAVRKAHEFIELLDRTRQVALQDGPTEGWKLAVEDVLRSSTLVSRFEFTPSGGVLLTFKGIDKEITLFESTGAEQLSSDEELAKHRADLDMIYADMFRGIGSHRVMLISSRSRITSLRVREGLALLADIDEVLTMPEISEVERKRLLESLGLRNSIVTDVMSNYRD